MRSYLVVGAYDVSDCQEQNVGATYYIVDIAIWRVIRNPRDSRGFDPTILDSEEDDPRG